MKSKWMARGVAALVTAQTALVLFSWIMSAAMPDSGVRSVISGQSVRFFLGGYAGLMGTDVLVWLLLLAMAYGSVKHSGLATARPGHALYIAVAAFVLFCALYALMSLPQHSILQSATGELFASHTPFMKSLIPSLALMLCLTASVYGALAGVFASLADICRALFKGIADAAPLFLYYVLITQIYYTVTYMTG